MSLPKIIFAGTPDFSVPCLEALLNKPVNIVGVYTQPDRVAGRGKKLQQSPVKQCALAAGLPVFQPDSFKAASDRQALVELQPELMVVVAYGLLLPQSILDIPKLGCVNIHASLLPRWRGAAPIQRALEAGDQTTGVCLMQMEKGLDTGPVLALREHQIGETETGGELHDALSLIGANLLEEELDGLLAGRLTPVPQIKQGMRYAHKLNKQETRVDWSTSATDISNKIRAFNPWPVMSSSIEGQTIRLLRATVDTAGGLKNRPAGEILNVSPSGITVNTGSGSLIISQLQKPGGRVLGVGDFLNGFALNSGQHFE